MNFPGYHLENQIHESAHALIFRAVRQSDRVPVVIKVLKADSPSSEEAARIKREYGLLQGLDLDGVVKVLALEHSNGRTFLVLEDFGGQDLKSLSAGRSLSMEEILSIGFQAAQALGHLHAVHIIHKDIKPSNLVFHPETGQLKIIDLGSASMMSREMAAIRTPDLWEGTLPYMSPEQTGRMNRWMDWRTDFYSLGVTLYEFLTGGLPFAGDDPLELVHAHLVQTPIDPQIINPKVPAAVSRIVLKLLAKDVEDRYQSAWGLKADLEECLKQLHEEGEIRPFPLGLKDIPDRFQVPQRLYGREAELEMLLTAFERTAHGRKEMMLITGQPGIGKTALVNELYKPITRSKGYFISGKFDQFQRNVPYSAVVAAFRELVKLVLSESQAELDQWRERIQTAVGNIGQVVVNVIPEVEWIIGPQKPVPELGAQEAQNRFQYVFQNFIQAFCRPEHPLAVFLDDLQWADAASLKFIEMMMNDPQSDFLFFMGAYRDSEVHLGHPLMLTLEALKKEKVVINEIALAGLTLDHLSNLIADALKTRRTAVRPLAELVFEKTLGNPFFVDEFLKSLYVEKLLEFDTESLSWRWDVAQIKSRNITDNVVELLADKIRRLSEETRLALQLAAILGNTFDLERLAIISEKRFPEVAAGLKKAVEEGFVIPLGEVFLTFDPGQPETWQAVEGKFAHDRIQQAAYSLIPENDRAGIHLRFGRLMLNHFSDGRREACIIEMVNHMNLGLDLIQEEEGRTELAELNLKAGKKAKANAAWEPAYDHFKLAMNLISPDGWKRNYKFTLDLHDEAAEVAYIFGDYEGMDKLIDSVFGMARNILDKTRAFEIQILSYEAQDRLPEAVQTTLDALRELGVRFPAKPKKAHVFLDFLKTKLMMTGKTMEELYALPETRDKVFSAIRRIGSIGGQVSYNAAPNLLPLIALHGVRNSLRKGLHPVSSVSFVCYGMLLIAILGDVDGGLLFGQLGMDLSRKINDPFCRQQTDVLFNIFIRH